MPAHPISTDAWTETDLVHEGFASQGIWCANGAGELALKKPCRSPRSESHEAFREFIAASIAAWLGVHIPKVQLVEDPVFGPCSLSWKIRETALRYEDVMLLMTDAELSGEAQRALPEYIGRIVVLDALLGAEDRHNQGNHVFLERSRSWTSLDYGFSFNSNMSIYGVGKRESEYRQRYLHDIKEAARLGRRYILETILALENVPDEVICTLLDVPPAIFANKAIRRQTAEFIIDRKARIRHIVDEWWRTMGLPGSLREWLDKMDPSFSARP